MDSDICHLNTICLKTASVVAEIRNDVNPKVHNRERYYFETDEYSSALLWMELMKKNANKKASVFSLTKNEKPDFVFVANGICVGYGLNTNNVCTDGKISVIIKRYIVFKNESTDQVVQLILSDTDQVMSN